LNTPDGNPYLSCLNTYKLFNLETGVPTDDYDLEEAINDKWLVPPRAISVQLAFPLQGIKYDDLSEEEKKRWEATDWADDVDEDEIPDSVQAEAAVNKWLFNTDTVDKALEVLMTRGHRVAGGDRLGKTIIFAKSWPWAKAYVAGHTAPRPQSGHAGGRRGAHHQQQGDDAEPRQPPPRRRGKRKSRQRAERAHLCGLTYSTGIVAAAAVAPPGESVAPSGMRAITRCHANQNGERINPTCGCGDAELVGPSAPRIQLTRFRNSVADPMSQAVDGLTTTGPLST
jgi:hypothetical protein